MIVMLPFFRMWPVFLSFLCITFVVFAIASMRRIITTMFVRTSPRTTSSVERISDPVTPINYLCGYSLHVCTLYLLWIHFVWNIFILCTTIVAHAYVTVRFTREEKSNSTLYTVTVNDEKIFDIDTYSNDVNPYFRLFFNRMVYLILNSILVDIVTTVMALFGVYKNKILLMLPYIFTIFTSIVWCSIFLILFEIFVWSINNMAWSWVSFALVCFMLVKDSYRFAVLFSYFRTITKHCFSTPRTPLYSSTQSPYFVRSSRDRTMATTTN